MGPYRHVHDFTHDVDHVRKSLFFRAGSKVIRVLIARIPEGGRAWKRGYINLERDWSRQHSSAAHECNGGNDDDCNGAGARWGMEPHG